MPRTRWATASATSVTAIAPTNAAPLIPSLPATSSPPIHCDEPRAGDEHDDGHAERGAAGDAEHERVGQRVAEDRLHLRAAQAEGGAGEHGGDRPRQAHLAHDVEGAASLASSGRNRASNTSAGDRRTDPRARAASDGDRAAAPAERREARRRWSRVAAGATAVATVATTTVGPR